MNADDFGRRLDQLRPTLKAYAQFVIDQIEAYLRANLTRAEYEALIKVGPSFRVKDSASAVEKVSRKGYSDPVGQMTDIVGVRFVVLLQADLAWIEKAVLNCNSWTPRKDRTPLIEIAENPEVFEYQSVHFIVNLNEDLKLGDFTVPADTPCEIQIRTLVQHAYSEFVHDRVYKGGKSVPTKVRRLVARAMAMLEATDEIFSEATKELAAITTDLSAWDSMSADIYTTQCGESASKVGDEEAKLFYETFHTLLSTANSEEVRELFAAHAKAMSGLKDGANLFSHSFIVPLLWLLQRYDQQVTANWCFGKYRADLETAAAVLGVSLNR